MTSAGTGGNSYSRSTEAIFISHATEDGDFARVLSQRLALAGFETWHQREMTLGNDYMSEIDARLDRCKAGIVIWSQASVRSEYVKAEANHLRERKCLVSVYIEDCKPPVVFGLIQGIKCRDPRNLANEELLALCDAIHKLRMFGTGSEILAEKDKASKITARYQCRVYYRNYSCAAFRLAPPWALSFVIYSSTGINPFRKLSLRSPKLNWRCSESTPQWFLQKTRKSHLLPNFRTQQNRSRSLRCTFRAIRDGPRRSSVNGRRTTPLKRDLL